MQSEIFAEIISSIILGIFSAIVGIFLFKSSKDGNIDLIEKKRRRLYQYLAGISLVVCLAIISSVSLINAIRPSSSVVLSQSGTSMSTVHRPELGVPGPRGVPATAPQIPTPSNTPTNIPSPTATSTQSPSLTPSSSPIASLTNTPTPSKTPTPPPAVISNRRGDCDASPHGVSLITGARIITVEIDSAPVRVIELLGQADRLDFVEYLIFWRPMDQSENGSHSDQLFCHPYPSPTGRDCRSAAGDSDVLQRRKLSDLPREVMSYNLILQVLGNSNGQYAECIVTLDIRFQ